MKKRWIALFAAVGLALCLPAGAVFADSEKITYTDAVATLAEYGVMEGKENNLFDPKGELTRGEMAKIITALRCGGNISAFANYQPFPEFPMERTPADVLDHWSLGYVQYLVREDFTDGCGDGNFHPDDTLTGLQCAKMLMNLLGYVSENEGFLGANWEDGVLARANELKLFDAFPEDFDPAATITREQAAQVLVIGLDCAIVRYDYQLWSEDGMLVSRPVLRDTDPPSTLRSAFFYD